MRELELAVGAEEDGLSAAAFLKRHGFSRRLISSLKFGGGITRGGEILRGIDPVYEGEVIRAVIEDSGGAEPNPGVHAETVYEDADTVVFEKPAGIPVHQSFGHLNDTLANLFAARYPGCAFRAINRLDKNTSGLCVCAKNRLAASILAGNVSKIYYAVIDEDIAEAGMIDAPIGRVSESIILREVRDISKGGQPAVTLYKPVLRENGRTLLEITLKTGRTHQIRVHFSHIGYPLCGDDMYGGDCTDIQRQALHCGEVWFTSPVSGETVRLRSELPEDMKRLF